MDPADAAVGADVAALDLGRVGLGRPARLERRAVGGRDEVPELQALDDLVPGRARAARRLACSSGPSGETSAIATGASSNARRKRSSECSVAARPRSLARQETRFATASAATNRPWIAGPAPRVVRVVEDGRRLCSAPITPCWSTTKPIASRYAHHSS